MKNVWWDWNSVSIGHGVSNNPEIRSRTVVDPKNHIDCWSFLYRLSIDPYSQWLPFHLRISVHEWMPGRRNQLSNSEGLSLSCTFVCTTTCPSTWWDGLIERAARKMEAPSGQNSVTQKISRHGKACVTCARAKVKCVEKNGVGACERYV